MTSSPRGRLHARQFLAGPVGADFGPPGFRVVPFGDRWQVGADELVPLTQAAAGDRELLCIGHLLDPRTPTLDNQGVLARLAEGSHDFRTLERLSARLGGRWVLFARIGSECRLYPDAVGSKAVFHVTTDRGLWVASQPGLFSTAGIAVDPALSRKLERSPRAVTWPAAATPYPGVSQLLPNRYLDLASGCHHRYWPGPELARWGLDEAATAMGQLLAGMIQAAMSRGGPVALALTGGIDSRTMLACAGEARSQLGFFTLVDAATPFHDVWIPWRLAGVERVKFRFVWVPRIRARDTQLMTETTGGLWRDPNQHRIPAFGKSNSRLVLLGTVSEVCRCFYYSGGDHPDRVDVVRLAELAGWGEDEGAREAYRAWLSECPAAEGVKLLDLFYWEARLGNWAALDCMAIDAYADVLSPFNCRELLEIGLGVDVVHRQAPHQLHRRICQLHAPEILEFAMNWTRLDSFSAVARRLVPSRIRSAVQRARRRVAGASG